MAKNQPGALDAYGLLIEAEIFRLTKSGQEILASLACQQAVSSVSYVKIDDYKSLSITPDTEDFYPIFKEANCCARK